MTRTGSCLVVAFAFAISWGGAGAAESPPADEDAEPERAPGSTTLGAPAPPETPAPLLAPPPRPEPAPPAPEPAVTKDLAPDPRFGDPGQIALNGALSASVGHLGYDSADASSTSVSVEPAFDYFSAQNFSEGVTAFFRYNDGRSGDREVSSTTVGATGRIGHNFWLGRVVSLWPKLSLGVWHTWYSYAVPAFGATATINGVTVEVGPSTHLDENVWFAEIQAPVLFHLAPHFYVGFGPDVFVDLIHSVESAKNLRRFVGAFSTLGGWF